MPRKKAKYKLSDGFYKFLVDTSEGFLSSGGIEKLFSLFQAETENHYFTSSSEANLIRIINAQFDGKAFISDCLKYKHRVEITVAIASNSNYLTDILVRNPGYLYQLFDNDYLSEEINYQNLITEINTDILRYKTFTSKLNFLKNVKQRYFLKIALNDIYGQSLIKTTANLSSLANAIISALFELSYKEILSKYGITGTKRTYCLISLGKLGGNELNYSSDIDLMLFFDKNGKAGRKRKEYFEILEEATQLFIKSASEFTSKGYLYRVDFRLRPDGRHSPLARTFADTITYYETKGEDWEKQMLIKSGYVAGSKILYNRFKKFTRSYIFAQPFKENPGEVILRMKKNIEKRSTDTNVKLFQGGIRDIEFSVQALQLINGKRIPELQTPNTLQAINVLRKYKLLSEREAATFRKAYTFYRLIEHFLQLMNDKQTHSLPSDNEIFLKLVHFLNFKTKNGFMKKLDDFRKEVRKIFLSIAGTGKETLEDKEAESINFEDVNRSHRYLEFLRTGSGLLSQKKFDRKTIELFTEIEPALLNYLGNAPLPDKTIENFARFIERVKFPSLWYSEFRNKKFFRNFLDVCQFSQQTMDILNVNIKLSDFVLNKFVFYPLEKNELNQITLMRLLLTLSVQYTLGIINRESFAGLLTRYLHLEIAKLIDSLNLKQDLFIGGLGSSGIEEMSFNSDIDLIVVAGNIKKAPELQNIFQAILKEMNQIFKPFKVDFRLRPEGEGSPLVWDLEGYKKYLEKRARVWEFLALTKLTFIWGNKELFETFRKHLEHSQKKFPAEIILKETVEMYNTLRKQNPRQFQTSVNLKKSRGTLITLDFIVQYLQLKHSTGYRNSELNFAGKIKYLKEQKLITASDAGIMEQNYAFLKNLELAIQNIFKSRHSIVPTEIKKLRALSKFIKAGSMEQLQSRIKKTLSENVKLFDVYVK